MNCKRSKEQNRIRRSHLGDRIKQFQPSRLPFPKDEKETLSQLVDQCALMDGLAVALAALWDQQRNIGFILGAPSKGENLHDESRFLSKNIGRYWLIHSDARKNRKNIPS